MIFNDIEKINEYIRIASEHDVCHICAIKHREEKSIKTFVDNVYKDLEGKIAYKKCLYINRRGFETFICEDCLADIIKEHFSNIQIEDCNSDDENEQAIKNKKKGKEK